MKRAFLYSLILLGLSTLLVQCVATQKDMEYTNVQMRKVDSKVEDIDKEVSELKKQTVKEVRERQAETGDRIDYHQSEILRLQGEIEENNFFIRQVQEENKEMKKLLLSRMDISERNNLEEINKLKDRLALTEAQLLKAHDRMALTEDQLLKAHGRLNFAENEIKAIKEGRSKEASKRAMEAAQRAREAERKARLATEKEAAERKTRLAAQKKSYQKEKKHQKRPRGNPAGSL